MKIVFLDAATVGGNSELQELNKIGDLISYGTTPRELVLERINSAEIVLVNKVRIDREILRQCPSLKLICLTATGMDNVDLEYAKSIGVEVKNVKGYSTESVVQATFSTLLHLNNHNAYYDEYVKSGKYSESKIFTHLAYPIFELKGKQFGIIGMGDIGNKVANIAKSFGSQVVYHSTSGKNLKQPYSHLELDELLETSDIISIHAPLNSKTRDLISTAQLLKMKNSAILINMGRGGIINEEALAKALDTKTIRAAGIDVLSEEPIRAENPLLHIKNKNRLFITPHIAWASREARTRLIQLVIQNIMNYIATKK